MGKLDGSAYLIISDVHLPYEHRNALEFCHELKIRFQIPDENCYSVGDLVDNFWASQYPKGGDYEHTPNQELEQVHKKVEQWAKLFPKLKICHSNHASRVFRTLSQIGFPSQVLKKYHEIIGAPDGWEFDKHYVVISDNPFMIEHGEGYSGLNGHRQAAIQNGISTAMGHLHSKSAVSWIHTKMQAMWSANIGCLIDNDKYAFKYGRHCKDKPAIGALVVLDGGRVPLWIPLE